MVIVSNVWVTVPNVPVVAAKYSDGEVISHYATNSGFSTISFSSSSDPDERGIKWTQPIDAVVFWVWLNVTFTSLTSDFEIVLYNSADNALSTTLIEPDLATGSCLTSLFLKHPITRTRLREGEIYRLTMKPTTTENITVNSMAYLDEDSRKATFGFGHLTTRTNGGAWTDTLTDAMQMTPIMSTVNIGRGI